MIGIALSVGASGALISQTGASAAISEPTVPAPAEAFSSDSKSETATESSAQPQQSVVGYHTIESGESLWQIAQRYQVGLQDLKSANALPPETSIRVGQVLKVPGDADGLQSASLQNTSESAPANPLIAMASAENVSSQATLAEPSAEQVLSRRLEGESTLVAQAVAPSSRADSPSAASLISQSEGFRQDAEGLRAEGLQTEGSRSSVELAEASVASDLEENENAVAAPTSVAAAITPEPPVSRYQVRAGDTINSIAAALGTTPAELVRTNRIANPNVIFVGSTLVVPTPETSSPKRAQTPDEANAHQSRTADEQLAYLRGTAVRPDAARMLEDLREAAPTEALSIGGEQVTQQDVLSTDAESEGVDPYVANLLEEVQAIRSGSVQSVEVASAEAPSAEVEANRSLLARARDNARTGLSQQSVNAVSPARSGVQADSQVTASAQADSELLAAAPLSPDAYIPARRSAAGQVVSPDMPLLPSSDEYLPEAPESFNGFIWPAQGTVTSGYGWRWGRMHRGVDIGGPVGTPIVAAGAGVVENAGWNSGGFGNLVEIRHPNGSMTRYAHNSSITVSAGQTVRQGEQIALMGSTGYSTGPHLHFEVHENGSAVNPVAYLPSDR
jgi:murein DD-endopeptidase MepM/ murein hydrolase activator NlpD